MISSITPNLVTNMIEVMIPYTIQLMTLNITLNKISNTISMDYSSIVSIPFRHFMKMNQKQVQESIIVATECMSSRSEGGDNSLRKQIQNPILSLCDRNKMVLINHMHCSS